MFLSYRYKNGRPRPYTVQLGRIIKQRLWEKLNCPQISLQEGDSGLLMVSELHEDKVYPPLIEVDISHEPDPREPSRGKKQNTAKYKHVAKKSNCKYWSKDSKRLNSAVNIKQTQAWPWCKKKLAQNWTATSDIELHLSLHLQQQTPHSASCVISEPSLPSTSFRSQPQPHFLPLPSSSLRSLTRNPRLLPVHNFHLCLQPQLITAALCHQLRLKP